MDLKGKIKHASYAIASLAIAGVVSGCSIIRGGWDESESTDPISGAITTSASKDFDLDGDQPLKANFRISCIHEEGSEPNPLNLIVSVAVRDKDGKLDSLDDSPLEYNLAGVGRGQIRGASNLPIKGLEGSSFRMSSLIIGANGPEKFGTLLSELNPDQAAGASMAGLFQTLSAMAEANGVQEKVSEVLSQQADAPSSAPVITMIAARESGNFKWGYEKIILRFSANGGQRIAEVPLNSGSVVKVAETCGWKENPAPLAAPKKPTAPAKPIDQPSTTNFGYLKEEHGEPGASCGWVRSEDAQSTNSKMVAYSDLAKIWFNINGQDRGYKLITTPEGYAADTEDGNIKIISGEAISSSDEMESSTSKYKFIYKSKAMQDISFDMVGTCGS